MQPAARDGLTADEVKALLEAPSISISAGLERIEGSAVVADLSGFLLGGSVERSNYAQIHGSCSLELATALAWGRVEVRPYMDVSDGSNTARFYLGVYRLSTPTKKAETTIYKVSGDDRLTRLNTLVGETYRVAAGTVITTEVNSILAAQASDVPRSITPSSLTFPYDVVVPLDDKTTWLGIVNSHLQRLGYRGLWADWTGGYRSGPYVAPSGRGIEWSYTDDRASTILGKARESITNIEDTPNRWVFVNEEAGDVPLDTDVYEVVNQSSGPTSIDSRGGLVNTAVHFVETCGCSDSLQQNGDRIVEQESRLSQRFEIETFANPLHWHFDILGYTDTALGTDGAKVLSQDWSLSLTDGSMKHSWKVI